MQKNSIKKNRLKFYFRVKLALFNMDIYMIHIYIYDIYICDILI